MSEFRRRLMMVGGSGSSPYDKYGYIKDGKIFHLDGIDKGETADAWTELTQGLVFQKVGNVESLVNGWRFPGNASNRFEISYTLPSVSDYNATVEVCYYDESTAAFVLIHTSPYTYKAPQYSYYNTHVDFIMGSRGYTIPKVLNSSYTVSLNKSVGYYNGIEVFQYGSDTWNSQAAPLTTIGCRKRNSYDYPFKGIIYSIRFYNRVLTTSEMMHNQQIDNQRFNLGLTI